MRLMQSVLLVPALLAIAPSSAARAPAEVVALNPPAFRVNSAGAVPLAPGMELAEGDVVRTGAGARVVLDFADSSTVKLGERARFEVESFRVPTQSSGVFEGVISVLEGAFRYTTRQIAAAPRRDLSAKVGVVTIGIRGTDVWGKSDPDRDFVVLIEGTVEVAAGGTSVTLDSPRALFNVPSGEPPDPVGEIDADSLERAARETELISGAGVQGVDGEWIVALASYRETDTARANQKRLAAAGYVAAVKEMSIDGTEWHRLVIEGLRSQADASMLARTAMASFGYRSPWVLQADR